jgi:uncharacterized protein Yka (UPF0111/DUF47 family)
MDDVQKGRIRLTHWIDHNLDHLKGYAEVAETMEQHGFHEASEKIRRGMKLIEDANTELAKAVTAISRSEENSNEPDQFSHIGHHGHHQGHEHGPSESEGHHHHGHERKR